MKTNKQYLYIFLIIMSVTLLISCSYIDENINLDNQNTPVESNNNENDIISNDVIIDNNTEEENNNENNIIIDDENIEEENNSGNVVIDDPIENEVEELPETIVDIDEGPEFIEEIDEDDEEIIEIEITPEKFKVKGIYINTTIARNPDLLDYFIDIANKTEINTFVIDIKTDSGFLCYTSDLEAVKNINASYNIYDIDYVAKILHDNNIRLIGRVVTFKDSIAASKIPSLALYDHDGTIFYGTGSNWLDPTKRDAWIYIVNICKEAIEKGFDEIQFDYVRFPSYNDKIDYDHLNKAQNEYIRGFLNFAEEELPGVVLSVDMFGIACIEYYDSGKIGHTLDTFKDNVEYICPMLYPSHFANGSTGVFGNGVGTMLGGVLYEAPDLHPYEIVYNSLVIAKKRIEKIENYEAVIRPYIQAFTAGYMNNGYYQVYGVDQMREQIKAVYDAGYEEWIFWDQLCRYRITNFVFETSP